MKDPPECTEVGRVSVKVISCQQKIDHLENCKTLGYAVDTPVNNIALMFMPPIKLIKKKLCLVQSSNEMEVLAVESRIAR